MKIHKILSGGKMPVEDLSSWSSREEEQKSTQ